MGGSITAVRPTYSIRIQPRGAIVETRLTRTGAEAYVQQFNKVMADADVWAESLPEDGHVSWPNDDPVGGRSR